MSQVRLTQRELNQFRRDVDSAADLARTFVLNEMDGYLLSNPSASASEVQAFANDLLRESLPTFCDGSAELSAMLFDEIAESLGADAGAEIYDVIDYGKVESKVNSLSGFLEAGDTTSFKRELADAAGYYVKRSAFGNMRENCIKRKMMWARVPSGRETCGFCFMLASRGFEYVSEKTALVNSRTGGKYHVHCDCLAIPGFPDPVTGNPRVAVDGYDPEGMYDRWCDCCRTIGIDPLRKRTPWTDPERKAAMREVETRDPRWLYKGEAPKYKADEGADPDDFEKEAGRLLREKNGLAVEFKARSLKDRRADTMIGKAKYEIKNPAGSTPLTVHNQVKKNLYGSRKKKVLNPQSDKIVISNVRSNITFDEMIRQANEVLGGKTGFSDEELRCISEILILDKTGNMRRLKR